MSFVIQFIILLFKIALLASFYATIGWFWIFFLSKLYPEWRITKLMKRKVLLWFSLGILWSVLLFCYSFSYWGYAGLGSRKRIPVGYGKEMIQTELMIDEESPECSKWQQHERYIFGVLRTFESEDPAIYIIWDLKSDAIKEFKSAKDYEKNAISLGVLKPYAFKGFQEHYANYWWGWKLIFLP